jgi:ABC-type phosphate transport system substrate-binding protein
MGTDFELRSSIRCLALVCCVLSGGAMLSPANTAAQDVAVAIVVHPDTDVENLTLNELKRIFRGDRQFWDDGRRVTLLVRAPEADERQLILDRIYGMDEGQFREYWIGKMFRAEVAAGPKLVYSSDMARDLVRVVPGAITFVPVGEVSVDTKVVRIDGLLPSDTGYILR